MGDDHPFTRLGMHRGFHDGDPNCSLIGILLHYDASSRAIIIPAYWDDDDIAIVHDVLHPDNDQEHISRFSGMMATAVRIMLENGGPTCRRCMNTIVDSDQIAKTIANLSRRTIITTVRMDCRRCGRKPPHHSIIPLPLNPVRIPISESMAVRIRATLGDQPNTEIDHRIPVMIRPDPPDLNGRIDDPEFVRDWFQLLSANDNCRKRDECSRCVMDIQSDEQRIEQIEQCQMCRWNHQG
jgi:hypothetical protein